MTPDEFEQDLARPEHDAREKKRRLLRNAGRSGFWKAKKGRKTRKLSSSDRRHIGKRRGK